MGAQQEEALCLGHKYVNMVQLVLQMTFSQLLPFDPQISAQNTQRYLVAKNSIFQCGFLNVNWY